MSPCSGSLRATRKYANPTNDAKITTAIVDVVLSPVKSKNGLLGNNSKICCGNVCAVKFLASLVISLPRECSALPRSMEDASKPVSYTHLTLPTKRIV